MSCRKIIKLKNGEYINKYIPYYFSKNYIFPNFNKIINDPSLIQNTLNKINITNAAKQAIVQQYNEIFIYNYASWDQKNLLAPQLKVFFEPKSNLPIITYPYFTPLIEETKVWKMNEKEIKVFLEKKIQRYMPKENMRNFFKEIENLCFNFELREDDLLKNPSNLGYNPILGVRIIDYGLTENNNTFI